MNEKEFMTDSQGRQVPAELVSEIDKLRDQTVRRIADEALQMKKALADFKQRIRDDIYTFVELSAKQYGRYEEIFPGSDHGFTASPFPLTAAIIASIFPEKSSMYKSSRPVPLK